MKFFSKKFNATFFNLFPLGDWHLGSRQCDVLFIRKVIGLIKNDPNAYWVGMGDLMENAIIGSKGDLYTQALPPREQMDYICNLLDPIAKKGLFLIGGNHEQRTMRAVGTIPEQYFSVKLGIPFMGFSCMAVFDLLRAHAPRVFSCYFHHNYGGGYMVGSKINRASSLRKLTPTVDAVFSGHFHTTSRIPVTWFEAAKKQIVRKTGYDYITGSALMWDESYAEERAKPASSVEHIRVTFAGSCSGHDHREQRYEVITP